MKEKEIRNIGKPIQLESLDIIGTEILKGMALI